ncbi:helix-turn-helix domain-containing protein [Paenibacillus amylolyticus]|nr:helix-turn-helix domain-containing protein [Paenibacillus amylolyticus]
MCSSFLLMLAEQHGQMHGDQIIINLPMTHQEFANSIGTTKGNSESAFKPAYKENLLKWICSRIIIHDLQALKQQRDA